MPAGIVLARAVGFHVPDAILQGVDAIYAVLELVFDAHDSDASSMMSCSASCRAYGFSPLLTVQDVRRAADGGTDLLVVGARTEDVSAVT